MSNRRLRPSGFRELVRRHLADTGPHAAGTVRIVHVVHADDCRRPDGGPCTCTPEILSGQPVRMPERNQ